MPIRCKRKHQFLCGGKKERVSDKIALWSWQTKNRSSSSGYITLMKSKNSPSYCIINSEMPDKGDYSI